MSRPPAVTDGCTHSFRAAQRTPCGRLADLLIASIAVANQVPVYTRNPTDFAGLESLVAVVVNYTDISGAGGARTLAWQVMSLLL